MPVCLSVKISGWQYIKTKRKKEINVTRSLGWSVTSTGSARRAQEYFLHKTGFVRIPGVLLAGLTFMGSYINCPKMTSIFTYKHFCHLAMALINKTTHVVKTLFLNT